ncbi:MAG: hypothetical protein IKD74_01760 [Clostridia bacterium]|nr:hypothetical protein [Clostridia bacterium]
MSDIKTKDIKPKSVKTLDKTIAWTERIKDPIVYANEKSKDVVSEDGNIVDYGSDKIKYVSNRAKDESVYAAKKGVTKTKDVAIKKYQKKKLSKATKTDKVGKTIKTSKNTAKKAEKAAKEAAKVSKRMAEQGKKLAIKATKATVKGTKAAIKATISAIKAIIAGVKSLVAMLAAGGAAAVIAIVIICLIGLLVTSIFGIFFSSDSSNQIKMSDCIVELNEKMDGKIAEIERREIHDEVIIESNQAPWKDILSIYAVRVSNGNNDEVMTITPEKKKILEEVFWDMNYLTYETKVEKYKVKTIDSRVHVEISGNSNYQRPTASDIKHYDVESESEVEKRVLHININSRSPDELKSKYNFNATQLKQYDELSSDKYITMWASAIYGVYGSSGEIATWKQKGREWSNIRIGNTNKTIGDVGCLVTSVSILIKKSGVPTKDIYPFNPGTFVTALNNVYGFDGANLQYGPISKVVPGFVYQDRVMLKGKTKAEKLALIRRYQESGYYLAAEVAGATETSQHWVAIDNVVGDKIYMLDPGSEATDMWAQYDWNLTTQFVYFKATK